MPLLLPNPEYWSRTGATPSPVAAPAVDPDQPSATSQDGVNVRASENSQPKDGPSTEGAAAPRVASMIVTNSNLRKNSTQSSQKDVPNRKRKATTTNASAGQGSKNHRSAPPKKPSAAQTSKGLTSTSHRQVQGKAATRSGSNAQRLPKLEEYVPGEAWCNVEVSQELTLFPNDPRRLQGQERGLPIQLARTTAASSHQAPATVTSATISPATTASSRPPPSSTISSPTVEGPLQRQP